MKNDFLGPATSILFPKIDLTAVKGVLIDLDNTLYCFYPAHEVAMKAVFDLFRPFWPASFEAFYSQVQTVWSTIFDEMGNVPLAHHRMLLFQRLAEELFIPHPFDIATRANNLYFNTVYKLLKKQGPDKQALAFLKECRRRKIKVCCVTDLFASIQTQKIKALKLTRYIDFIVSNDEVGLDKPAAQMFLRGLKKLNMRADQVIMVGDDVKKDIEGAEKLKIRAYHVTVCK